MAEGDNPQGGADKIEGLQKLLAKKDGDAMAVAALLFSENYDLREKNHQMKDKLPAEGSVVITKDEATQFEAFKALNIKPEDVKKLQDGGAELTKEVAQLKKEKSLREVADAGYSFDTLRDFDALEGEGIEEWKVEAETKDGKIVKKVFVKVGGQFKLLDEYAQERRPALASIIKRDVAQGGTKYVEQAAGGNAPAADKLQKIRDDAKAAQEASVKNAPSIRERFGLAKTA
jgi:hypothetical protein